MHYLKTIGKTTVIGLGLVFALLAGTVHAATLAYDPDTIQLTMRPGERRDLPLSVKLTTRVRGSQLLWFLSDVTPGNLPMDWMGVDPSSAFLDSSVHITAATVLSIHVPDGTPGGVYSGFLKSAGMGAHSILDPGAGLPVSITVEGGCSSVPEVAVFEVEPAIIWPPNHDMESVHVSGRVDMDEGCSQLNLFYSVQDEYGVMSGNGDITPDSDGAFIASVPVEASRNGGDKDGRHYSIIIFATNEAGTGTSLNLEAVVPHDQGKK